MNLFQMEKIFESNIFESHFKLNYKNLKIEKAYELELRESIKSKLKLITIVLFIFSLWPTIEISFFYRYFHELSLKIVLFLSYLTSFILGLFCIVLFYTKNMKIWMGLNLANYYLLIFIFFNLRFPLIKYLNAEVTITYFIQCFENVFRMFFFVLGVFNFYQFFYVNLICLISLWLTYGVTFIVDKTDLNSNILLLAAYSVALEVIVLFGYFYLRIRKIEFFHNYLRRKSLWFKSILDTMNTGFISFKLDKIKYVNKYLLDKLEQSPLFNECRKKISEDDNLSSPTFSYLDANLILFNLLKSLNRESIVNLEFKEIVSNTLNDLENSKLDVKNLLSLLISKFANRQEDSLVYLGELIFMLDERESNQIFFEVFFRCSSNRRSGNKLELLLKDITEAKNREKRITEFTYKSTFFSKIAHEFKNPLLCMNELIEEIADLEEVKENIHTIKFNKNMEQIKNMSNYLLILVRDLEYFSQSHVSSEIRLDKKETEIDEILDFVRGITRTLLKKNNKSKEVKLRIVKEGDVPGKLILDQWRLKQILINLMSNAVKFTNYGSITLTVSLVNEKVKFEVRDTGPGIKEDVKKNIFKPYERGNEDDNLLGAGLGLSIVKDLVTILGSEIHYDSSSEGSSFWFSIPLEIPENLTDKKEYYSDTLVKSLKFNKYDYDSVFGQSDLRLNDINSKSVNLKDNLILVNENIREDNIDLLERHNIEKEDYIPVRDSLKSIVIKPKKVSSSLEFKLKDSLIKDWNLLRICPSDKFKLVNILIADDEKMMRISEKKILKNLAKEYNIKLNILESEDGMESLYLIYKCIQNGVCIDLILSDETMNFMNGSKSAELIHELLASKNIKPINFFLVTAYDNIFIKENKYVQGILAKPLSFNAIQTVFKDIGIIL